MEHVTDHCPQIEYLVIMTMSIVLHFAGTTCLLLNAHYPDVMNMTVPGFIWMIRGSIAPLAFSFKNMVPWNMYYHFGSSDNENEGDEQCTSMH